MDRVVIGAVPHKLSVTIEARDNREVLRATGEFATGQRSCRQLPGVARQWPERIWAVEGAGGGGRRLAQRLLADGERVLDVPANLAARARVSGTGQRRKTDATDAHAIVMVALRDKGLREVSTDPELTVLRMLRPPRWPSWTAAWSARAAACGSRRSREVIAARLRLVPRFRQLLYVPRPGLGRPLWVEAPAFDLADHVRVVPVSAPGDEAALLRAAEQLRRVRLDRSRPLWQMWLLPGLPEGRVWRRAFPGARR